MIIACLPADDCICVGSRQTQRGVNGDGMPTEEDDEREAATKEGLEEGEDLETLTKARDWDDWKDGEGNMGHRGGKRKHGAKGGVGRTWRH